MTEHKPWLSLPDEDPPDRGFAELMAAARVKAEVMANPPWWKRLFAVARRPPVLALATVVVVVCGVLVVGRPHEEAMPPAPAVDVPAGSLDTRARGITPESPPPPMQQAPLDKASEEKHEAKKQAIGVEPQVQAADGKPNEKPVDDVKLGGDKLDTTLESEPVDTNAPKAQTTATNAPKGGMKKAPADPLARCRAAAARRDCVAAKACVAGAPATYKANAASDAALKSCL